jgi:hypothetical protein
VKYTLENQSRQRNKENTSKIDSFEFFGRHSFSSLAVSRFSRQMAEPCWRKEYLKSKQTRFDLPNSRTEGRKDEQTNERTNKRTNKQTNQPTNQPTNEQTNERTNGRTNGERAVNERTN